MVYIVESDKSFYEASVDLEEVILRLGFSLLHVHDLGASSGGKELEFDEACAPNKACSTAGHSSSPCR